MTTTTTDELWQRWRLDGDASARDTLLQRYFGLVRHAAREVAPRVRDAVPYEELVSAGSLGLLQAMGGFDPERGLAFSTFAMRRIRGAILDELRAHDPLTRTERVRARQLEQAVITCEQQLGRPPSTPELAQHLGVDGGTLHRWRCQTQAPITTPIDRHSEGKRAVEVGDPTVDLHQTVEHDEQRALLRAAIATLPPREGLVITRSYLEEWPLHQIAAELGVTESRVSQLRAQGIRLLRAAATTERV